MQNTVPIEHFADVRQVREALEEKYPDGAVYLMSRHHRQKKVDAGRLCVATTHVAALMILQETHREANKAEILNWAEAQLEKGKQLKEQQAKKETKVNIDLGGLVRELRMQLASESEPSKGKAKEAQAA